MTLEKLIIVGSGPAGYTAAIYAARANLEPILFEGSLEAGGALMNTTEVENFPGFPQGIMGPELMDNLRAQAERFGTRFITDDVTAMKLTPEIKGFKTSEGLYKSKAAIIATGSAYKKLGIDREDELSGRGVSYCATCDGFFFREKDIIVVGGGDSALEEALFLTKFGSSVKLLVRSNSLRASKIMQERALAHPKLEVVWDTEAVTLLGDKELEAVEVVNNRTNETQVLSASAFFIAIGHSPRSELLLDYLPVDEIGYVLLENNPHGITSTKIPGLFVAGDVADHRYRQAITAAGTGAAAAIDAERWLETS